MGTFLGKYGREALPSSSYPNHRLLAFFPQQWISFQHPLPASDPDSYLVLKSSAGDVNVKSGLRTTDFGRLQATYALGLLPVWLIKSLGSTQTQMFSLSPILTSSPWTHFPTTCHALHLLTAHSVILIFPMWISDL